MIKTGGINAPWAGKETPGGATESPRGDGTPVVRQEGIATRCYSANYTGFCENGERLSGQKSRGHRPGVPAGESVPRGGGTPPWAAVVLLPQPRGGGGGFSLSNVSWLGRPADRPMPAATSNAPESRGRRGSINVPPRLKGCFVSPVTQDPAGIFELVEVVGNGTYGQVYKVGGSLHLFVCQSSEEVENGRQTPLCVSVPQVKASLHSTPPRTASAWPRSPPPHWLRPCFAAPHFSGAHIVPPRLFWSRGGPSFVFSRSTPTSHILCTLHALRRPDRGGPNPSVCATAFATLTCSHAIGRAAFHCAFVHNMARRAFLPE